MNLIVEIKLNKLYMNVSIHGLVRRKVCKPNKNAPLKHLRHGKDINQTYYVFSSLTGSDM